MSKQRNRVTQGGGASSHTLSIHRGVHGATTVFYIPQNRQAASDTNGGHSSLIVCVCVCV